MQTLPRPVRRSPGHRRLLALTGLLTATALFAVPPLGAAAATPYGSNLVKNGGAENGLSSWDPFGNATTRTYDGTPGFPSKAERNRIGGSSRFFYAGAYELGTCGDLQQSWTLKGIGSTIDAGKVRVRLQGYAATNGAADLFAHVDLYFRDADGEQTLSSSGIKRKVTQTNQKYVRIDVTKTLPKHARKLRLHLWADGAAAESSGDCAAFWDKLSVTLTHV